jgi:hypothetical protein
MTHHIYWPSINHQSCILRISPTRLTFRLLQFKQFDNRQLQTPITILTNNWKHMSKIYLFLNFNFKKWQANIFLPVRLLQFKQLDNRQLQTPITILINNWKHMAKFTYFWISISKSGKPTYFCQFILYIVTMSYICTSKGPKEKILSGLVDHHKFTIYTRSCKERDRGQKMPSVHVNSIDTRHNFRNPTKLVKKRRSIDTLE